MSLWDKPNRLRPEEREHNGLPSQLDDWSGLSEISEELQCPEAIEVSSEPGSELLPPSISLAKSLADEVALLEDAYRKAVKECEEMAAIAGSIMNYVWGDPSSLYIASEHANRYQCARAGVQKNVREHPYAKKKKQ
jgi:hypothetical protein